MKILKEIIDSQSQPENYKKFERKTNMPPLNLELIKIQLLLDKERSKFKDILYEGNTSILLGYKNKNSFIMSFNNIENELWNILQLQGIKSRKSYRILTSLDYIALFANIINQYTKNPGIKLRQITMPHPLEITNITNAKSEMATEKYLRFANLLEMKYSKIENKYVKDIKK